MAPELDYAYLACSTLVADGNGSRLALATSGGTTAAHPYFFSGFVEHPAVVAQALLVIARVARTRFYVPPNTLAAILRAADPVVTSTPEGLRFESFSVCCGVYSRLDIDAAALDAAHLSTGVTNVDVNPPLRQALAALRPSEPLHLNVGHDELRVSTIDTEIVEDKVPLPHRWLKGFAETQMLSANMALRHELDGPAARQFVQTLPRSSATKSAMWATRAARSLRLASRPSAGAVCLAGPERLRVLEPLLRFATGLRVYGPEAGATSRPTCSAWVLDLPGARVTIALSPEKARGFSGEGAVLHSLAAGDVSADVERVAALLSFDARINVNRLASELAIPRERVQIVLSVLASSGQVGYDLTTTTYFHRPMPVRQDLLDILHPRLADAHQLILAGAVHLDGDGLAQVDSAGTRYEVRLGHEADADRCSCPWYAKYQGTRGPCKHSLAARMTFEQEKS